MNLEECRARINTIDDEMLKLFIDRMKMANEVAKYKAEHHLATLNPKRERDILLRISEQTGEELGGYARVLFSTLFDLSRSYQRRINAGPSPLAGEIAAALEHTPELFPTRATVACQGVDGAYSQLACDKFIKLADIVYVKSFEGVFQAVEQGLCDYGVLPIENSLYGTVGAVYDLMRNYNFHIVRSLKMHVSHALLVKPGTKLSDVREIISHDQALGQCSRFIKSLKDVKVTICENTAIAAKMVAESDNDHVAAISSHRCAELYGLESIAESIQNNDHNYTRFICISRKLEIYPGANRVSLIVSAPHRPGALYNMMAKFASLGLNLTKLESRPIPGRDFEFLFYFDLEATVRAREVVELLNDLASGPDLFVFLGCYTEV